MIYVLESEPPCDIVLTCLVSGWVVSMKSCHAIVISFGLQFGHKNGPAHHKDVR